MGRYVPGELRLRRDNEISVSTGERPTFPELIERIERRNSHGGGWNTGFLRMENWGGGRRERVPSTGLCAGRQRTTGGIRLVKIGPSVDVPEWRCPNCKAKPDQAISREC